MNELKLIETVEEYEVLGKIIREGRSHNSSRGL